MKNKSPEETVNFIDMDRRRFLERAGGAVAGSLILPAPIISKSPPAVADIVGAVVTFGMEECS